MKITEKDVQYVAELAHLDLTAEENALIGQRLESILEYVAQLQEVDTSSVTPMAQVLTKQVLTEHLQPLRNDALQPSLEPDVALSNAPERGAGYFKVPKVIERG